MTQRACDVVSARSTDAVADVVEEAIQSGEEGLERAMRNSVALMGQP